MREKHEEEYAHRLDYWESEIGDVKLLQEKLPKKPYCSNDLKKGLLIRPRNFALTQKYIELNPVHQKMFITFDIDYRFSWLDLRDYLRLPMPMWVVRNKKNGHAHLIYALSKPVYTTSAAHFWPLKFLSEIERAYREKLEADPMYSGLISKNPWSDFWEISWECRWMYALDRLADAVILCPKSTKHPREEVTGLGRNCAIFENVRIWSYREVRRFWKKGLREWQNAVEHRCLEENTKFTVPLGKSEIRQIAKSISRWTWRRMTPERFSDWQRSNIAKRWAEESKKELGIKLLEGGMTPLEVSQELGASLRTCERWRTQRFGKREIILPEEYRGAEGRRRLTEKEGISLSTYYRKQREVEAHTASLSERRPWESLGISRATWYRLKDKSQE